MTAPTTFAEATVALHRILADLEELLEACRPLEEQYAERWREATDPATGDRIGVAGDNLVIYQEEFTPYYDAAMAIHEAAEGVERRLAASSSEHWSTSST